MSQINPLSLIMIGGFIAAATILVFVLSTAPKPVKIQVAAIIDAETWQGEDGARYRLWGWDAPNPGKPHESWEPGYRDECVIAFQALRDGKEFAQQWIIGRDVTITGFYGLVDGYNMITAELDNQDVGQRFYDMGFVRKWEHSETGQPIGPKPIWCRPQE